MESPENIERENIVEFCENENPTEELIKPYVFEKEKEKIISLSNLAGKEGRGIIYGVRSVENEAQLCNSKKSIEEELLVKSSDEISRYWKSKKEEYCANFVKAYMEGVKNDLPPSRRNAKNRTILDEETGDQFSIARKKAEKSFSELEKGMRREIIINKILNSIADIKAEIASSELDINNKIDILACSICENDNAVIIAVQVKGNIGGYSSKKDETIQEIFSDARDKKLEYYNGCEDFEKKLKAENPKAKVVKIWINVADGDMTSEGAGYDNKLKIEIEHKLNEVLGRY